MARRRSDDDDDVPRLPRGKGMALSFGQIVRIVMVATALIALIVLQKPCARSVSKLVTSFGNPDAGPVRIDAAPMKLEGEILRGDMTPEQMQAAIERERARAATDGGISDAAVDGIPATQPPQP